MNILGSKSDKSVFGKEILCLKINHLNQLWLNYLGNLCMKFGKRYVRLLMKNTIWNNYGIQVVRIELMSISTAKVEKPFVAYTQNVVALVS
ncbi:Uncharacterised protein [Hungatella hathewayi]|uniref:Uncharacterized protein n=1 Tax=Hungatella hathewayi TaxID=154046 RepID=A0A174BWU9_9FIRM|nr:Uncharacterised protein [Hungatella hathewayi]